MTIPFACLAIAFALQFLTKLPVGVAMKRQGTGYDNRHPRDQQAALQGWGRRALAAHQNSFESFPGFAAGVLVAHVGGGDPGQAAILAVTHIVARVAYSAAYIADIHRLRSSVWAVGTLASFALMLLPAFG